MQAAVTSVVAVWIFSGVGLAYLAHCSLERGVKGMGVGIALAPLMFPRAFIVVSAGLWFTMK